jgi:hypothetical protein
VPDVIEAAWDIDGARYVEFYEAEAGVTIEVS